MKIDRLLGILTILIQNDRVTAPFLAERFEVTRRTICRDIDALCQAGIPIVTHQGGGGGISIAEGYKLDKSILTTEELSGIIAALKGIGSVSEKTQIEQTLEKLSPSKDAVVSLVEPIIIDLSSNHKGSLTEKIKQIKRAILQKNLIEFDYFYEKGDMHRNIEPYFISFYWASWYVFGFCLEREDFRMFKLARLCNLHICESIYLPREIPAEKRDFDAHFTDHNKLVAIFDKSVKYQLIEHYGEHCYNETENGKLCAEIRYTNREYIVSWLLGFGDKVKIVKPIDIANEVRGIAENVFKMYE